MAWVSHNAIVSGRAIVCGYVHLNSEILISDFKFDTNKKVEKYLVSEIMTKFQIRPVKQISIHQITHVAVDDLILRFSHPQNPHPLM